MSDNQVIPEAAAHVKTDPVCVHYKETGPLRRYLNERGRGKGCPACVPLYRTAK